MACGAALLAPAFLAPPAPAAQRSIGGEIVILQGGEGRGPGGCGYTVPVVRYPAVRDAVSYRAVVADTYYGNRTFTGPPFQDDSQFGRAPPGTHQHELAGLFGGGDAASCADSAAYYRARMRVVSVVATLGTRTCQGRRVPGNRALIEGTVRSAPIVDYGEGSLPEGTMVGLPGVRVSVSGPTDARPVTAADGYWCAIVARGRYAIRAGAGRGYLPRSRAVTVTGNRDGLDFRREAYSISGRITRVDCVSVPGRCSKSAQPGAVGVTRVPGGRFLGAAGNFSGPAGAYTVRSIEVGTVRVTPAAQTRPGDVLTPSFQQLRLTRNVTGVDFKVFAYPRNDVSQPVAFVVELRGRGGAYVQRGGTGPLQRLGLGDTLGTRDRVSTDAGTEVSIESVIGGRAVVNPQSAMLVLGERRGRVDRPEIVPAFSQRFSRTRDLKAPLEIQTNGGVMGIKG